MQFYCNSLGISCYLSIMVNVPLLLFSFIISLSDGARILGVFPMSSPSHYILGSSLMKGIAEAGHDVTIISPFTDESPPKNGKFRQILLDGFVEDYKKNFAHTSTFQIENRNPFTSFIYFNWIGNWITEQTFNHTQVKNLMMSNEKFDVVIVGQFMNDGMKAFANHFNAHLVLFSNIPANTFLNHLVGNPSLPSYSPELNMPYTSHMSFSQRLKNTLLKLVVMTNFHVNFYPSQNKLIQKYFPNPVEINDILYNVSLVLLNSHISIADSTPSVPCMIDIGGFHVKPPKKLPADLQKFLDDAKEGVIYFSMGSNLKSKNLPIEKRNAILQAFSKRKEKILWKWEDDVLPGQPPNVKLGKWLPQQDILAHPNVKLFITHGGLLSTIETVYHGVPIIAIPIFGDQKMNANRAMQAGYGVVLPFQELSEAKLTKLLEEVLENPKYIENVKQRSIIMHDRRVKPIDDAVYWIEYVIRHKGAKHLRVPYLDLPWYQYYLLDVFAFIFIIVVLFCITLKKFVTYLLKRKNDKKKLKKN